MTEFTIRPRYTWIRSFIGNGFISGRTGIRGGNFIKSQIQVNDVETGISSGSIFTDDAGYFTVSGLDPTREFVVVAIDSETNTYSPVGATFYPEYY